MKAPSTRYNSKTDALIHSPALNLIEIFFLVLPFEWWMPKHRYERLNHYVMGVIYSPLLLVTAFIETRQAELITRNRKRGEADDDTTEEWESPFGLESQPDGDTAANANATNGPVDFENEGWAQRCRDTTPNIETEAVVVEINNLKTQLEEVKELVKRMVRERDDKEDGAEEDKGGE